MRCLNDSIRYDDPSWQRWLSAVEETHTLTALLLAVWPLACTLAIHIVASVLAARAQALTCWPPVRPVGHCCGVRAWPCARSRAFLDLSGGDAGSDGVRTDATARLWRPWM